MPIDLKTQTLLYVCTCIGHIHRDTHPMTKAHYCFPLSTGARAVSLGLGHQVAGPKMTPGWKRHSSLLWQCLFFGAVWI